MVRCDVVPFHREFIERVNEWLSVANMVSDIPNVEWPEARLAVFMQMQRLDENQKQLASTTSVLHEKLETKIQRDLHEAHAKIRALQNKHDVDMKLTHEEIVAIKTRVAVIASLVTGAGFLLLEIVRSVFPLLFHK
jgi:hypothetical protein